MSAAKNSAHLTELRFRDRTEVHGVEFALCAHGKRHRGYENVFDNGHRALFAHCGLYGFAWLYTKDVDGREPCRRCFPAPAAVAGAPSGGSDSAGSAVGEPT